MAEDNKLGWFDPSELCWHCLLVKGENSKDGILVDMEGYHYARYAAFVPDCGRLRLQDVPCRCTGEQGKRERQENRRMRTGASTLHHLRAICCRVQIIRCIF